MKKAVSLLVLLQMWERFSFFGMRVLLVLFLVQQYQYADAHAFGVYAVYGAMMEFCAIAGGYTADRFLGPKLTFVLGALVLMAGHGILAFHHHEQMFFLGLGAIAVGCGLFSPNIRALLGQVYPNDEDERERGYRFFYIGANLGGVAAALGCTFVAETFGYHAGFSLAAFGMFLGICCLPFLKRFLPPSENTIKTQGMLFLPALLVFATGAIYFQGVFLPILPFFCLGGLLLVFSNLRLPRQDAKSLGLLLTLFILFFVAEEQMCSTLVLFLKRHVEPHFFGFSVPTTAYLVSNPFSIVLIGPLFARLEIGSVKRRLQLAFLLLSGAFLLLFLFSVQGNSISGGVPLASFAMIALGELLLVPLLLSQAYRLAPKSSIGQMMSGVMLAHSLAFAISGWVSRGFAFTPEQLSTLSTQESLFTYCFGFAILGVGAGAIALFLPKQVQRVVCVR